MGDLIEEKQPSNEDLEEFSIRLAIQLEELRHQIKVPAFSKEFFSLGAELEVSLVDENYLPIAANEQLLNLADNPNLTLELNTYNLEINSTPVGPPSKTPFSALEKEMDFFLKLLQEKGREIGSSNHHDRHFTHFAEMSL